MEPRLDRSWRLSSTCRARVDRDRKFSTSPRSLYTLRHLERSLHDVPIVPESSGHRERPEANITSATSTFAFAQLLYVISGWLLRK